MSPNLDTETLELDVQHRGYCTFGIHHPVHELCNQAKAESRTAMDHQRWLVDVPDGLTNTNSHAFINCSMYIYNVKMQLLKMLVVVINKIKIIW